MYQKILVPLDGSSEAELVLEEIQQELDADGELILLRVISETMKHATVNHPTIYSHQQHAECRKALDYLLEIAERMAWVTTIVRCRLVEDDSIAQSIADFVRREKVELIAVYAHEGNVAPHMMNSEVTEMMRHLMPPDVNLRIFTRQMLHSVA